MARGRIDPPKLDDRNWQEIRDQAVELISKNCPAWKDHGPADPGIAIVEMFAWLVEGMIWRLDQVPERNYVEFLNLLGITRDPAVPATTWLTFKPNQSDKAEIPVRTQAGTIESSTKPAIVFETDEKGIVLPGELVQAWRKDHSSGFVIDVASQLVKAPLSGLMLELFPNRADSAESVRLESAIYLGFTLRPTTDELFSLHAQISNLDGQPDALSRNEFTTKLDWEYSTNATGTPSPIVVDDQTDGFQRSGRLTWKTPQDWTKKKLKAFLVNSERPVSDAGPPDLELFWIRIRWTATLRSAVSPGERKPRIRFEHLLFNSVPASNALTFSKASSGAADLISNAQPFQFLELANRPLYKRPGAGFPYDHVRVTVSAPGQRRDEAVEWPVVTELPFGPAPSVQVNPVAGTIEFGDGTRGMIPSAGSQIWVERYRYVAGGAIGNVLPEEVRLLQQPLNNVVSAVTNPGPGVGGTDEEDIERTKMRAPQSIKNRDRAVTTADFEFLAREASNRVKKVRCLVPSPNEKSPTNVRGRLNRGEGHINVLIVPNSVDLISEVQDHLDSRRMLTTRVHVVAPRNVPVKVTARFHLFPSPAGGAATSSDFENNLTQRIEDAIRAYLDPLSGRPSAPGRKDGEGWEIGQSLFIYELYDHLKPILGRDGYITKMSVNRQFKADTDESEFGRFKLASEVGISLADFEMISAAEIQDIRSDLADGPT